MKNFLSLLLFLAVSGQVVLAQEAELTLKNGEIIDDEVFFDIYIREAGSSGQTINLSHSDFVLFYNDEVFDMPVLSKVQDPSLNPQRGYCNFTPTSTDGGFNDILCQSSYYNGTSAEVLEDQGVSVLIINLNSPSPGDQTGFNDQIAIIDSTTDLHRLGRYKISGHLGGKVELSFKLQTPGLRTKINSYDNFPPFYAYSIPITVAFPLTIEPVAIFSHDQADWEVQLLPNPTAGQFTLNIGELPKEGLQFLVFDAMGREFKAGQVSGLQTVISLDHFSAGVYWLQLKSATGEQQSHKLVKL